jgi:uncharacterized protein YcaQ
MNIKISNQQTKQLWLQSNQLQNIDNLELDLLQIIKDLGFVQLDTIQNVTRAHHHILWSRNNKYQENMFDEILKNTYIFEHFTHDASVLPIEFYPYWSIQYTRIKEKIDKSKYYKNILDDEGIKNIFNRLENENRANLLEVLWENHDGKYTKSFSFLDLEDRLKTLEHTNKKIKIINPFDPAIRDRIRLKNIFGFDYKIEIFVAKEKRIWGYYVYPLLFENEFIARIELSAHRKVKELTVLNFWKENNVIWDDEKQKLLDAELRDFASFVGIDDINWVCDKLN